MFIIVFSRLCNAWLGKLSGHPHAAALKRALAALLRRINTNYWPCCFKDPVRGPGDGIVTGFELTPYTGVLSDRLLVVSWPLGSVL